MTSFQYANHCYQYDIMISPSHVVARRPLDHLNRAARLELAGDGVTFTEPAWAAMRRAPLQPAASFTTRRAHHCLACLSPIATGIVCGGEDSECGDLWYEICPTRNGKLYALRQPCG
jgi:hypothetical protein